MSNMLLFAPMVRRTASAVPCGDNRINLTMRTSTNVLRQIVAGIGNIAVPLLTILSQAARELSTALQLADAVRTSLPKEPK